MKLTIKVEHINSAPLSSILFPDKSTVCIISFFSNILLIALAPSLPILFSAKYYKYKTTCAQSYFFIQIYSS